MIELQVERDDLRVVHHVETDTPVPARDQVLLRVERFGLSANNITYAVRGGVHGYWRFFPAAAGNVIVPVWGFGEVIASGHDAVPVGQRVYGYLPMASHLLVSPSAVTAQGFVDAAPHRAALPAIYNYYRAAGSSPDDLAGERALAILRPIALSAWLLADYLADQAYFSAGGAGDVLLSSASSKTAMGCAHLVAGARGVVGLTSGPHVDFVAGLGCYRRVVAYDRIASLAGDGSFAFVDLTGDLAVRRAVHEHLGDQLRASVRFGSTHLRSGDLLPDDDLPGPRPVSFPGPAHLQKRYAELGVDGVQQRMAAASQTVIAALSGWLRIVEGHGAAAVERVYLDLLAGRGHPDQAHVLSFTDG